MALTKLINVQVDLTATDSASKIGVAPHVAVQGETVQGAIDFLSAAGAAGFSYTGVRSYTGDLDKIYVYGREHVLDNAQGYFTLDITDTTSQDNDGTILVDYLGRRWKRIISDNTVNVLWFGAKNDGTGNSDDSIAAAVNTSLAVFIPAGFYLLSATIKPVANQLIYGEGTAGPEVASNQRGTRLNFASGVNGFDFGANNANGAKLKGVAIFMPDLSSGIGVMLSASGSTGTSQSINTELEDVFVRGGAIGFAVYGWSWESTFKRCFAYRFNQYGFDIADSANVVTLESCRATHSALNASGTRTGIRIIAAASVNVINPRIENNRVGFSLGGGASVTIYNPYMEGNRDIDFRWNDPFTTVHVSGGVILHTNDGVNTVAVWQCEANCDPTTYFKHDTVYLYVSRGVSGLNNSLSYAYVGNSNSTTDLLNITWRAKTEGGGGSLWANFAGRYAPRELSLTNLPQMKLHRLGVREPYKMASDIRFDTSGPPPAALYTLLNVDGSTRILNEVGSKAFTTYTATIFDYFYDGTNWVARS